MEHDPRARPPHAGLKAVAAGVVRLAKGWLPLLLSEKRAQVVRDPLQFDVASLKTALNTFVEHAPYIGQWSAECALGGSNPFFDTLHFFSLPNQKKMSATIAPTNVPTNVTFANVAEAQYKALNNEYFVKKRHLDELWSRVEFARGAMQEQCDHDWEHSAEWGGRSRKVCKKCGK